MIKDAHILSKFLVSLYSLWIVIVIIVYILTIIYILKRLPSDQLIMDRRRHNLVKYYSFFLIAWILQFVYKWFGFFLLKRLSISHSLLAKVVQFLLFTAFNCTNCKVIMIIILIDPKLRRLLYQKTFCSKKKIRKEKK